jgi:hypothetical protein
MGSPPKKVPVLAQGRTRDLYVARPIHASFATAGAGTTKIQPIALVASQGIAYLANMTSRRVLAISLNDIPDITEAGELVFIADPPTRRILVYQTKGD